MNLTFSHKYYCLLVFLIKVELSVAYILKVHFLCFNERRLKWWKVIFILSSQLSSFLRYLNFDLILTWLIFWLCSHVGKRLEKKPKVNFKKRQGNEIWSVNTIWHDSYFSWNIIHKIRWRTLSLEIQLSL